MTNILRINIEEISNPVVKDNIRIINKAAKELHIDYFIIGAQARDLWFEKNNLKSSRLTKDIDFAIHSKNIEEFNSLINLLISKYGFRELKNNPHRLIYEKENYIVDFIPFGEIERNNEVNFGDKLDTQLNVLGLSEEYENMLDNGYADLEPKIATLPGLCILKLLAWHDNQEIRNKDIIDFYNILKNYYDLEKDDIFQNHLDLFHDDNFEKLTFSARVLGRHMKPILSKSDKLFETITEIISENIQNPNKSKICLIIERNFGVPLDTTSALLQEILTGIKD